MAEARGDCNREIGDLATTLLSRFEAFGCSIRPGGAPGAGIGRPRAAAKFR
jgi:hypothetical protein